jgi:hypothetical protein
MSLDLGAARRYAKQIALPELGADGQERVLAAEVALASHRPAGGGADDVLVETCALYLAAAGVRRFRRIGGRGTVPGAAALPWPADGAGWEEALRGATLVVRSGLDDDSMVKAAVRLGIPAVVARGGERVELLSLRRHGPCPHQALDVPGRPAAPWQGGAVLAGALAASEALLLLAHPGEPPPARHLALPLEGVDPIAAEIPWAPECFLCGGQAREVVTR